MADLHPYAAALKIAEKAEIPQPEPFSIPVTIRVLMWPTAERRDPDSEIAWRPTPKEIAKEIQDRLAAHDLDTGWTIGSVTGGV